ncbi:MAG TPA: hypothetical protein VEK12_10265, partial [Alphaproteobacteria bacterium]|nr:hypothetical protein [Alphaproteobacteria bacterium]
ALFAAILLRAGLRAAARRVRRAVVRRATLRAAGFRARARFFDFAVFFRRVVLAILSTPSFARFIGFSNLIAIPPLDDASCAGSKAC